MVRASVLKRFAALSACVLIALASSGCGTDTPSTEVVEQNQASNQAAARAAAYGNANNPGARGRAAKQSNSGAQSKPK